MISSKFGLALGGGAAKGPAHIGVLKALEEGHIKIDAISGTSVGALIASLYAFGKNLDEIFELAKDMTVSGMSSFTIRKSGFATTDLIEKLILDNLGDVNIEDAIIPLAIIATDIHTGEEIVFKKGKLSKVVAASVAVPGIFIPVEINKRKLVDGGIVENVPISPLKKMGVNTIIAVDLNGVQSYQAPNDVIDIVTNALDIAIDSKTKVQLKAADLVVSLDLVTYSRTDNRARINELIDLGYSETKRKIARIVWYKRTNLLQRLRKFVKQINFIQIPNFIKEWWGTATSRLKNPEPPKEESSE